MKLAIHLPNFTLPGGPEALGPVLAATARAAEDAGVDTLTLMDHWFQMESISRAEDPMLDGYTALGYLAGQTKRITLGLLVTGVTYRHPGLLAKTVTTLDVLSGGRAQLGIGAAWYEREHRGLGVPFPPLGERFEWLEETLQIVLQMWSGDDGPYSGKHFQLAETLCRPQPIHQPHPPILIGGSGEKKTLRLVAQYANACNLFAPDPETIAHKLRVLAGHCETLGRDPSEIEKTIIWDGDPLAAPDAFIPTMAAYAELGIEKVYLPTMATDPAAWVTVLCERFGDALAALEPGAPPRQ